MKTKHIVEGLLILQPHYKGEYNSGAEHDQFYAYATDTPLTEADAARMHELGWFQEGVEGDEDSEEHAAYDPDEGWSCFT